MKKERARFLCGLSGVVFVVIGLYWTLSGDTSIGMMNLAVGCMNISIAAFGNLERPTK